ncbi:MAG: SDR family oxidoreductase [Actinomycetota bacterium]|nr:SDR family oxidoreductase [Actinomycetota bacterium]
MHLARAGHDVVVGYRHDAASAATVVQAITDAGARGVAVPGDVCEPSDVAALFAAGTALGAVTGLVNKAGLTAHLGDLADTPVDVVRRVIDVNLVGALLCARRRRTVTPIGKRPWSR